MKIMYVQHLVGGPTPLLPDETLCLTRDNLRALTHHCARFSRGLYDSSFCIILLRVTNRRVNITCRFFPLYIYRHEIDLWFPGRQPERAADTITHIDLKTGVYGRCVELISQDLVRRRSLFSSPDLTVRIYADEPERIAQAIREAMRGDGITASPH